MKLRPYQSESVQAIYDYFSKSTGNPLVSLPTGTGKSVVIAAFIRKALQDYPDTRVFGLTHVKELIQQNYAKLVAMAPEISAGIYSAGLGKRDLQHNVIFGGIQSLHRKGLNVGQVDLILVDEAHLMPRNSNTMYGRFLKDVRVHSPHVKLIGLTATPYRMDTGCLVTGKNALFDEIVYEMSIRDAIEQGWLSEPVPKRTDVQLDVSGVGTRAGEFIPSQLAAAVDIDEVTQAAVSEIITYGRDRKSWLVFCSGVDHALHVRDAMRSHGISCETVTGQTPANARARILQDYAQGRIKCLTNMSVLTTGFDAPATDLVALLRPTKSPGLLVQMIGRGTRLAVSKENCLVLDFSGNFERHGPIDRIKVKQKSEPSGEGEAPVKVCPKCHTICYAGVSTCQDCGFEFPPPEKDIRKQAASDAILSSQLKPAWVDVKSVHYRKHEKRGKPPSLCVEYLCGFQVHKEWIFVEHTGFPRQKACRWWASKTDKPVPATVDEALSLTQYLNTPSSIRLEQDGKYKRVAGYQYE